MTPRTKLLSIPARLVRRVERRVYRTGFFLRAESAWHRRRTAGLEPAVDQAGLVLLPTVGMGNIGDQAMLEAVIANVEGPITLVLDRESSHQIPPEAVHRVRVEVIPGVVSGSPWARRRSTGRFLETANRHVSVAVIGADIMDGGYDTREAALRFDLLAACNAMGLDTRVLGFSWNGRPPAQVLTALGSSQPQTLLCVRDPHSLARLDPGSQLNAVLTADTVFSLPGTSPSAGLSSFVASARTVGAPVVIVNASGLLLTRSYLIDEYVLVIRHLLARGCRVVLLPHVVRSGDDDLSACRAVLAQLGVAPDVHLVDTVMRPAEVAWAAAQAAGVLTGRMHLSILAMNQGVPAAVVSTQGKVSGLLDLFGLADFELEPDRGLGAVACRLLDRMIDEPEVAARVRDRLPSVRELSALNFHGLDS